MNAGEDIAVKRAFVAITLSHQRVLAIVETMDLSRQSIVVGRT
jgi:hypothetical protein